MLAVSQRGKGASLMCITEVVGIKRRAIYPKESFRPELAYKTNWHSACDEIHFIGFLQLKKDLTSSKKASSF
jgi:hypothetical protein